LTKKWIRERKHDYYHRLAKEEGYRSRAAYKLLQIVEKYHLIKQGDVVVDLGAAPGGWMQAARKLVGEEGYVLGIDLKPINNLGYTNVTSIIGDAETLRSSDVLRILPKEADVVLSDVSPNVSGNWELDHAKQIYLAEMSLKLAVGVLRVGANFLVKAFDGSYMMDFVNKTKMHFRIVRIVKPKASRKTSAEVYITAVNFNGKPR
jgi:23S rRNA (uridine2552-2'-O)-methyltransferase